MCNGSVPTDLSCVRRPPPDIVRALQTISAITRCYLKGAAMPGFDEWESFYVIVGAAAGALIGLQFVVMTLLADKPQLASPEAGAAFATPNVVHFSAALLLSALMRVPWHSLAS